MVRVVERGEGTEDCEEGEDPERLPTLLETLLEYLERPSYIEQEVEGAYVDSFIEDGKIEASD